MFNVSAFRITLRLFASLIIERLIEFSKQDELVAFSQPFTNG
ncbi:hypothetical protein DDD_2922 [Nonlabens dokdonensis DSW-6]|uniref:Uncharacterized protein n=1 Tax=Nonlabens dokdonensis (strain DSM 17205 / KCTC 12402 / DSW-6) TaxID=592029 RepID=L7WD74_NONDD|nr:hypothetical protein DDD_2922 [Nonlabens dokdonensis DSW-6]